MRFSHIIMAYFLIGAIMWAGGAIPWSNAGLGEIVVDDPTNGTEGINNETAEDLESTGGPIQEAISSVGGGALLAVWKLIRGLVSFMFWPMSVLISNGAPPQVWVVLGGVPTVAFYGAFIRLIRTSG